VGPDTLADKNHIPKTDAIPRHTMTPEINATRRASLKAGIINTIRQGSVITEDNTETHGYLTLL
jgi:hypothetical protein